MNGASEEIEWKFFQDVLTLEDEISVVENELLEASE